MGGAPQSTAPGLSLRGLLLGRGTGALASHVGADSHASAAGSRSGAGASWGLGTGTCSVSCHTCSGHH